MRYDEGRLRDARDDQVAQVPVVRLKRRQNETYEVIQAELTLTLHWPVPTERPFSNSLPDIKVSAQLQHSHIGCTHTEWEGDVSSGVEDQYVSRYRN